MGQGPVSQYAKVEHNSQFIEERTVDNKKTYTPCFSTLRFSRISPEPLKLQKIYLHFFISIFKELSAGTRIFQIR